MAYVIDMSTLKKEGEFGSKEWGEACARAAVEILEAADLPDGFRVGVHRVLYASPGTASWKAAGKRPGYYVIVKDGKNLGRRRRARRGAWPYEAFHIRARWAAICNQSGAFYGREGGRKRREGQQRLLAAIEEHVGRKNPYGEEQPSEMYWPDEVSGPLMAGSEEGNGLHNIAAAMQTQSPEFVDLPVTEMLVPIFEEMTEQQKKDFLEMLAVET